MKKEKEFYPLTNHVMFALVMKDPEICKGFLQRIFPNKKIKFINYIDAEKTLIPGVDSHSIRLDVVFEGNEIYDIELEAGKSPSLPKRCRYYSSVIDVTHLKPGERYKNLKPSYVIFLCLFDYFEMDQPIYFFQSYDVNLKLKLDDQRYIMILNSKCSEENRPEELRELFTYINGSLTDKDNDILEKSISDKWIESVHRRVTMLNEDPEVKKVMTLEEDLKIRIEEAYEVRLEEALEAIEKEHKIRLEELENRVEEVREEGKQETACKMKSLGIGADIISAVTGFTIEEIETMKKSL